MPERVESPAHGGFQNSIAMKRELSSVSQSVPSVPNVSQRVLSESESVSNVSQSAKRVPNGSQILSDVSQSTKRVPNGLDSVSNVSQRANTVLNESERVPYGSQSGLNCEVECENRIDIDDDVNSNEVPFCCRARAKRRTIRNQRFHRDREPSRVPYKKFMNLFYNKGKIIKKYIANYLRKYVPPSSVLRNMLCPDIRRKIAIRMSRFRPQHSRLKFTSFQRCNNVHYFLTQPNFDKYKKITPLFVCNFLKNSMSLYKFNKIYSISKTKLLLSGDVELNPGPVSIVQNEYMVPTDSMVLLQARLAEQGLRPLEVGSDGACFFRSVAHQLYNDPIHHMAVRAAGVQYLRNNPEAFIDAITEQSWVSYLDNMSKENTWCDALIVQALSQALNLTINITESVYGWIPVTVISPLSEQNDSTVINIGHLDEAHYVSTVPLINNDRLSKTSNDVSHVCNQPSTVNCDTTDPTCLSKAENRRAYMRQLMKRKRKNIAFKNKENIISHNRRLENRENRNEKDRQTYHKHKAENSQHIKDQTKNKNKTYKEKNHERFKKLKRQSFNKRKQSNTNQIKEINKTAQKKRRAKNADLNHLSKYKVLNATPDTSDKEGNCSTAKMFDGQNYIVRISVTEVIHSFHNNIACGPEYVCTCCDQLWYKSSVTKYTASKYSNKCPKSLLEECISNTRSVDNSQWICCTWHSNLIEGKLPACSKANKMHFPKKPDCLNLTPLEERLISPRIPFMQIRELPRGGQLSIHGNVVNVPADVSSTVSTLPRPIK